MGISGLSSFLDRVSPNAANSKQWSAPPNNKLISLVVDGSAFTHHAAKKASSNSYKHISLQCKNLALILMKYSNPFFIFDGNLPKYKISERIERNNSKLLNVQTVAFQLLNGHVSPEVILYTFGIQASFDTIKKMGLPSVVSAGEADPVLAYYSRLHNCPVLSLDSDFLIFDTFGYIPLDSLVEYESTLYFKEFKRERVSKLLGIEINHLPILAVLGGSDFITTSEINNMLKGKQKLDLDCSNRLKWPKIIKFVKTLSIDDIENAKSVVVSLFKDEYADVVHDAFNKACDYYAAKKMEDVVGIGNYVEMYKEMAVGNIHPKIIEILVTDIFWCNPVVENLALESCWNISGKLRELIVSFLGKEKYEEHIRCGKVMKLVPIQVEKNAINLLQFYDIFQFSNYEDIELTYHPLILVMRYLIMNRNTANYEIVGFICSSIKSRSNVDIVLSKTSSINSIHLYAQYDSTLFVIYLLAQLMAPNLTEYFWQSLDLNAFFDCIAKCRRGASISRLVSKKRNENVLFLKLYAACSAGLEDQIENVFDYGSEL
jgi:hypothetical protein